MADDVEVPTLTIDEDVAKAREIAVALATVESELASVVMPERLVAMRAAVDRLWADSRDAAMYRGLIASGLEAMRRATRYLVIVTGDIEPEIVGPFRTEEDRDKAAFRHKRDYGDDDGIFPLDMSAAGTPEIWAYSGGYMDDGVAALEAGDDDEPGSCECDNTHEQNDTVCRWCYARGRRRWSDPEI